VLEEFSVPSPLYVPSAGDPAEVHADFIELAALRKIEDGISLREFLRDLSITGTTDAYDSLEQGQDPETNEESVYEAIAEAAFNEIDDRVAACGDEALYPYRVERSVLVPKENATRSVYLFLATLSHFGLSSGPAGLSGSQLFEDLCAAVARDYLGGTAESLVFGFPRRILPSGFGAAVDAVCKLIGEGGRHRDEPTAAGQKDAKLDIIAWKDFADRREGKIIALGQCATGRNWEEKATELSPSWPKTWLQDVPAVDPIRMLFVPHRVERRKWRKTASLGGILFDRCRIAQHAACISDELIDACEVWNSHLLESQGLN
jgi:hypothetical protein